VVLQIDRVNRNIQQKVESVGEDTAPSIRDLFARVLPRWGSSAAPFLPLGALGILAPVSTRLHERQPVATQQHPDDSILPGRRYRIVTLARRQIHRAPAIRRDREPAVSDFALLA
jgi:hypothetical protein